MGEGCTRSRTSYSRRICRPVRIFGPRRPAMHGGDRRLQSEWTGSAANCLLHQRHRLGDLPLVPTGCDPALPEGRDRRPHRAGPRAVNHAAASGPEARSLPRAARRHQRPHQPPQPDGLGAEIGPNQRFAAGGRIAFVEDQINHRQHGIQTRGHIVRFGHANTGCRRRGSSAWRAPAAAPSSPSAPETRGRSRRSRGRPAFAASARPVPRWPARGGSR